MYQSHYDDVAGFYAEFVRVALSSPTSVLSVVTEQVVRTLGNVKGLNICDLACGEGHLSRRLAEQGAEVTGVDISEQLLIRAMQHPSLLRVNYIRDDAQTLFKIDSESFDVVFSNLALMDIPSHASVFASCSRILKPGGSFVFSVLHPCFETPFDAKRPLVEVDRSGAFLACRVSRYLEEGFWVSGGEGVRGKVGAYHRTLSTYLNDLLAAGFRFDGMLEPTLPKGEYGLMEEQWLGKIPRGLVIRGRKA